MLTDRVACARRAALRPGRHRTEHRQRQHAGLHTAVGRVRGGSAARSVERQAAASMCRQSSPRARRCSKRASGSNSPARPAKAQSPISWRSSRRVSASRARRSTPRSRASTTPTPRSSQSPTSATARQQVIVEGQTLSRTFNDLSTRFQQRAAERRQRNARRPSARSTRWRAQIADINAGICVDRIRTTRDGSSISSPSHWRRYRNSST